MKLEQALCLGGRYNNKTVRGIKFNGHHIYPNTIYNIYEVKVPDSGLTVYFDGTNRVNSSYVPYYDLGNGDINPLMNSKELTVYRNDSEGNLVSYKQNFFTYKYTTPGTYTIRTTEALHDYYSSSIEHPIKSVIALRFDLKDASYLFEYYRGIEKFDINQHETLMDLENADSMFFNCESLKSIDLSGYLFPKLRNMDSMFYGCESMTYANFSGCNLSSVTSCRSIFADCTSLENVNFTDCNLSGLTDLSEMTFFAGLGSAKSWTFKNCNLSGLTAMSYNTFSYGVNYDYIDFSCADLSNVTTFSFMDSSATRIDLSNAKLFKVTSFRSTFDYFKGKEINLSGIDTSKITDMYAMFFSSSSLESVDLSDFRIISDSVNTDHMFYNCTSLYTIKLNNCNNYTIRRIINSESFPTDAIDGVTRKIYCKEENAAGLIAPTNWVFEFVE